MIVLSKSKIILPALFLFFTSLTIQAQSTLGLDIHIGSLLPNNPTFPEIKSPSVMSAISLSRYTNGKKYPWTGLHHYPTFSLSLTTEHLSNQQVIGNAYGLLPSMSFYLNKNKKWTLMAEAGLGIAWLNKPFNKLNNPENVVIGAHWNFMALLRLKVERSLSERFILSMGIGGTHYSNGNFASPNLGANQPAITLGFKYRLNIDTSQIKPLETIALNKKIRPFLRTSFGLTETGFDGPKYPVYTAGFGALRQIGQVSYLSTGVEFIFKSSSYEFMRHIGLHEGRERQEASRYLWFVGHEFVFGNTGFLTELGLYFNKHYGQGSIFSSRVGFHFYPFYGQKAYLKRYKNQPSTAFLGLYVHAYLGEAEFVELAAGFRF